jgi:hypothetical protein
MAVINKTGITNGTTIQAEHVTRAIDALSGGSTDTVIASGSFSGSLVGGPVNVSTVAASTINCNGTIVGTSLFIDNGNAYYGISATADSMSFNSQNEDFNTEIYHHGGVTSTIFSANGISTNNRIVATSFTGSLQGTASFATQALSSSFATTASFALNAGGGGGVGFPFTGSAQVTGSMGITGSLTVSGSTTINGTTNLTGSINVDQSAVGTLRGIITGGANLIIDLTEVGKSPAAGTFIIPNRQPDTPYPGSIYIDAGRFYIYDGNNWRQIQYI